MTAKKIRSRQATGAGGDTAEQGRSEPEGPKIRKPGNGWRSERQQLLTLEYARRTVWANLQAIVEAAIRQSLDCNYSAAKFLCDFAQVADWEEVEEEEEDEQAIQYREDANAVEWFFKRIGIDPPAGSVPKKPTEGENPVVSG